MDDLPINQQVAFLNIFKEKKYPLLISALWTDSSQRAEAQRDSEFRKKLISASRNRVREAGSEYNNLLKSAIDSLNGSPHQNGLTPAALDFSKLLRSNATTNPYFKIRDDLQRYVFMINMLGFIHSAPVDKLAVIYFHNCFYPLDHPTLPNWPSVYYSLLMNRNISTWIRTEGTQLQAIITNNELQRVLAKLRLVNNYLFNSHEFRYSQLKQQTYCIDYIKRFIPQRESFGSIGTFPTPARQSIEAFRKVLNFFGYSIKEVNGDGNCFFRAVVKSVVPQIERSWEDNLSLLLRQRANPGNAQKLQDNGQSESYPYREFVIKNVNDSSVMSRPGVWADHIQIQKLSDLLNVCFFVVMYDDVGLHVTYDGRLIPGPDYNVGQKFLTQHNDSQQTSYQLITPSAPLIQNSSLFLYFNPNPGHYEALIPPPEPLVNPSGNSLDQVIASLGNNPSYVKICQAYFLMIREVEETDSLVNKIRNQEEKKAQLYQYLAIMKMSIRELSRTEHVLDVKGPASIYQQLLFAIAEDDIEFNDAGVVTRFSEGPLSTLASNIQRLGSFSRPQYQQPKINSNQNSEPSLMGLLRGLLNP